MRYVAPRFHGGRIGHQLTTVWQARLAADLFGLQYLHVPFSRQQQDIVGGASPTGEWNAFLGLGRGETLLSSLSSTVGYVTYRPPPHIELTPEYFSYEATWRLVDALPDNHVLVYDDLGLTDYRTVRRWHERGLITAAQTQATLSWFQRQLRESAAYIATQRTPRAEYSVAAYRRAPLNDELLPPTHRPPPIGWFNDVLACVRRRYPAAQGTLYTQGYIGDETQLDDGWVVRCVPDTYPATLEAFKDLIESDLAVTSTGSTTTLVQLYRHGQRPTVHHPTWSSFPGLTLETLERELP
jgi:hypothetical protein